MSGEAADARSPGADIWNQIGVGEAYACFARQGEYRRANEHLLDLLALERGQLVVDAGSGTGIGSEQLARRLGPQGRVIGVDSSPLMIEQARRSVTRPARIEFRLGDAHRLSDIVPECTHGIVSLNAIHLMDDPEGLLRAWYDKLVEGGWIAFNTTFFREAVPKQALETYMDAVRRAVRLLEQRYPGRSDFGRRQRARLLSKQDWIDLAHRARFVVVTLDIQTVPLSLRTLEHFLQVPGTADAMLPSGLSSGERSEIAVRAFREVATEKGVSSLPRNWFYLVARKPTTEERRSGSPDRSPAIDGRE